MQNEHTVIDDLLMDLVDEYDAALSRGESPQPEIYLARCGNRDQRSELKALLWIVGGLYALKEEGLREGDRRAPLILEQIMAEIKKPR